MRASRDIPIAALALSALAGWLVATASVSATSYTHRLTLAGGESVHVECAEDALRMDRLQNETLAVVLYCYEEVTPPAGGDGQWMAKTK